MKSFNEYKLNLNIKVLFWIIIPVLLFISCNKNIIKNYSVEYRLPKVLFITTGDDKTAGSIPQGAILAVQSFKKHGVYVRLENRDIILKPDELKEYDIMILLSALHYHDADRKYSLTYMSDIELINIRDWIGNGGYLVAGDNIGRNTNEGKDRTTLSAGALNDETWILSESFGVSFRERDISGFELIGTNDELWNEQIRPAATEEEWGLTIESLTSQNIKVLAEYRKGEEKLPAMTENNYGKGKALILPTSYILHPANDGGLSSAEKIEKFYNYILNSYLNRRKHQIFINPWKDGYNSAFCLTFNASGDKEQFRRILELLDEQNVPATFFIDSTLPRDIYEQLTEDKNISLQSNSFSKNDLSVMGYPETKTQILMNQNYWNRQFIGFRFPYTKPNYWGYYIAATLGYIFDSSIGVEYLTGFRGSVFPYNIPIANSNVYQALDMLELSPVQNDDYYFYQRSLTGSYSTNMQQQDAQLYGEYLMSFYKYAVEQNNGMMIFMGHPLYSGYSDATLSPLRMLITKLKQNNCQITTVEDIAWYTQKLNKLSIIVKESDNSAELTIHLKDGIKIEGLTLKTKNKPADIKGDIENKNTKELNGDYFISFDAVDGNVLELKW